LKRFRPRYLALRIESDKIPNSTELMSAMFKSLFRLYGEYGASKTRITLISYDSEKGFAVVRTSHESVAMVRTSIASITEISETSVAVHVLRISGTKKALAKSIDN
jgi:RNase P/RNase MRP subunit POP5